MRRYLIVEVQVGADADPEKLPTVQDWGAYKRVMGALCAVVGNGSGPGFACVHYVTELTEQGMVKRWTGRKWKRKGKLRAVRHVQAGWSGEPTGRRG